MRASPRTLVLISSALPLACSLMAPSDDYFVRDAQPPRAAAGVGAAGEAGAWAQLGGAGASGAGDGGGGVDPAGAGGGGSGEGGTAEGGTAEGGTAEGGTAEGGAPLSCGDGFVKDSGTCISLTGCSDGTREGFLPVDAWPHLAGCTAKWPRASLRAAKTGVPCGFELGACAVPADACGDGWHVCAAPPYGPTEISEQATAQECATQPGAYVAAVGDQFCDPCSETGDGAACCGDGCVQQHGNCIFPGETAWFGVYKGYKNVCGAIESDLAQRGVLCCRD